ncbi:MAG: 3'-5' exonuclease [Erysipelothrix sp.]|nr:3'-5' exonuclease [Erysipelothrix sp.]
MRFKGDKILYFVPDFTVIDLETTGRGNHFSNITEISAVKYRNYKEVATYSKLVKARHKILPFVTELTGITDEMLVDAPDISEVIGDFVAFLEDDVIVGHNVNFDFNLVYDAYYTTYRKTVSNDYSDTLHFSRILVEDSPNHKLGTLCQHFGIERDVGHRGLPDCLQTGDLYIKLKDKALKEEKLFVLGS